MEYRDFIQRLEKELKEPLPGEEAQFALAPYQRKLRRNAQAEDPSPKQSAVLILLYPIEGIAHTLLMLRNSYEGVHSAQVSFPGGKRDMADKDLSETALREAHEEAGIKKNEVVIIGHLSQVYIPPSRYLVQPYVGYLNSRPGFIPDAKEVCRLIEAPVSVLIHESTIKTKDIKFSSGLVMKDTPYFDIDGQTIWGATAMMLGELRAIFQRILFY